MAEQIAKKVDPTSGVELHVKIRDMADGSFAISYEAYIADTETRFHPRPAHVVGMLDLAAFFVANESFDSFKQELASKTSTVKDEKVKK